MNAKLRAACNCALPIDDDGKRLYYCIVFYARRIDLRNAAAAENNNPSTASSR